MTGLERFAEIRVYCSDERRNFHVKHDRHTVGTLRYEGRACGWRPVEVSKRRPYSLDDIDGDNEAAMFALVDAYADKRATDERFPSGAPSYPDYRDEALAELDPYFPDLKDEIRNDVWSAGTTETGKFSAREISDPEPGTFATRGAKMVCVDKVWCVEMQQCPCGLPASCHPHKQLSQALTLIAKTGRRNVSVTELQAVIDHLDAGTGDTA